MIRWAIENPILTFILLAMVIITIDNILCNFAKAKVSKNTNNIEKGE